MNIYPISILGTLQVTCYVSYRVKMFNSLTGRGIEFTSQDSFYRDAAL